MKINTSNTAAIEKAITESEGKSTTRLLYVEDVISAINKAEKELSALGITQKNQVGCVIRIAPEQVCNSYKSKAMGTGARLERFSSGWFMTGIGRETCGTKSYGGSGKVTLDLTDAAHASISKLRSL